MPRLSLTPTLFPLTLLAMAHPALADPLTGKSYIIEMSSSQMDSGYARYLLPPLTEVLDHSGMTAKNGPGADVAINLVTGSDVGKWVGTGENRVWLYTVFATVGISPEAYVIPWEGTPAFGITASLQTPNPDREDEMNCLIKLAARTALKNYRAHGIFPTDGSSCARK